MGASVGISCNGSGVCGVDIDVLEPDWAERVHAIAFEMLGPTAIRIGQAPKRMLIYRCARDTKYKRILFDDGRKPDPVRGAGAAARLDRVDRRPRQVVRGGRRPPGDRSAVCMAGGLAQFRHAHPGSPAGAGSVVRAPGGRITEGGKERLDRYRQVDGRPDELSPETRS